jgi:hypothetical protein
MMLQGSGDPIGLVTLIVSVLNGGGLYYLGHKLGQLDSFKDATTKTLDELPCRHNHVCRAPERER